MMAIKIGDAVEDGNRSHKIELTVEGRSVSELQILDYDLRIGVASFKMGGIGGVETHERHRMKGYASKVLSKAVEYMAEREYDVSMLFGISDFYHRWGFTTCLPEYELTIATRNAEKASEVFSSREFESGDLESILNIYEMNNRHRSCWAVRHKDFWLPFKMGTHWDRPAKCKVIVGDGSGRGDVLGYYAYDDSRYAVRITEIGFGDVNVFEGMLCEFARMAIERRAERISVFIPPDHPFVAFCRRFGCSVSIDYPHDAEGMMRIISLRTFLRKLKPELERTMDPSPKARTLKVITDIGEIALSVTGSEVNVAGSPDRIDESINIPQGVLMQLISGFRCADEIIGDPSVRSSGGAREMLISLFKQANPHYWIADKF